MKYLAFSLAVVAVCLPFLVDAQGRPPMRKHTATQSEPLPLETASRRLTGSQVALSSSGQGQKLTSNGLPDHAVGQFPNKGNPHRIAAQSYTFTLPQTGAPGTAQALGLGTLFGVAVNGVPFDPGAAEFWQGNPRSGWQYEALGGAVALGLDANYAHVQPSGAYHYHGLPVGLLTDLGWSGKTASPLIGYAADGYPIYAMTAEVNGQVVKMTSSYQLKSGNRPGGSEPSGRYDGAFIQDDQYVAGSGALDECNGAMVTSAEYPEGTYAYFLTDTFPVIPRCLKGDAHSSFSKRR